MVTVPHIRAVAFHVVLNLINEMNKVFQGITLVLFVGFLPVGMEASAQSFTDSIHHIEEVVIESKSFKEVISSQKLKGEELQRLNSHSVADALRFFAGVQLKDYGGVGGIKTVNIRSMGSHHVGVYYDGVQLSNAQNGQVDLGMYSLDNIESISLFNGQKSEIFQAAKDFNSAGSIYLWTRRPHFNPGQSYRLKANVRTGSFDLVNPSAMIDLKLSDNVSATFNAEWLSSSGKYKFRYQRRAVKTGEIVYDTTAVRHNGDIRATRLEAALNGMADNLRWSLKAYNYTSGRGVPGAIVNNVWRRGERIDDNNSFVQGMFTKQISKNYRMRALGKYSYYLTKYVNKDTTVLMIDNVYRQQELYLSTSNLFTLHRNWDVNFAYDFQWNKMDAEMYGFVYPRRYSHMVSLATDYGFGPLKMQASVVLTHIDDETKKTESPADKTEWTPAVYLSYRPFKQTDLTFRAFFKKSFRMPTFNDLYYAEMGNSKLTPEYTTQYNIGVAYNRQDKARDTWDIGFQVDAYINKVTDKIVAYPKGAQFRWTMLNLGKVDIKGIEGIARITFKPNRNLAVTGKLQYTYQEAVDVTNPADNYYRHQISYIPWHSGSAIVQVQYRQWGLDYSFIYTGERYNQQENIIYNHVQPWYTSDISLLYDFTFGGIGCRAMMEVNNLFSQDYDVILNYPMPKRNYRFTLRIEL